MKPMTCDILIKGLTIDVESLDADVVQDRLSTIVKAVLDREGWAYEDCYGVDSEDLLYDLRVARAIEWSVQHHKCYLTVNHLGFADPVVDVPKLLKRYDIEKGGRTKYD